MREREVMLLYEMNREAIFKVSTPVGMTEEVQVSEIVKQGSVFGPKLCCAILSYLIILPILYLGSALYRSVGFLR